MVLFARDVSYVPCVQGHSRSHAKDTFKLPNLHVLWPVSLRRNKVLHTAVLQSFISVFIFGAALTSGSILGQ